ncbi:hypothetical protein FLAVO9AF_40078 [Flavobacterium sp. 9AF]|nr:hypothetical protein FLAVO9AF_40078 [Flavobacterium sp. 9AF]
MIILKFINNQILSIDIKCVEWIVDDVKIRKNIAISFEFDIIRSSM